MSKRIREAAKEAIRRKSEPKTKRLPKAKQHPKRSRKA